jgi:biopolymer transport protein ExbD
MEVRREQMLLESLPHHADAGHTPQVEAIVTPLRGVEAIGTVGTLTKRSWNPMRKHHSSEADEAEVDMTPMLDIVFIMLIFFIVTTSFVRESGVDIARPSNSPSQAQETPVKPVVIKIDAGDNITVDNRTVDFRAVEANVQAARSGNSKAPVIVSSSPEASTDVLIKVVDAVKRAGVEKVNVATQAAETR